jgi:hypothetical protein
VLLFILKRKGYLLFMLCLWEGPQVTVRFALRRNLVSEDRAGERVLLDDFFGSFEYESGKYGTYSPKKYKEREKERLSGMINS